MKISSPIKTIAPTTVRVTSHDAQSPDTTAPAQPSKDRFTSAFQTGATVGGIVCTAAGLYAASKMGPTGLAVAGGIGAALTGGVVGAVGLNKIAGRTPGGEGAVKALLLGTVGLVAGAGGGAYLAATHPSLAYVGAAAGFGAAGALLGGTAGFFLR